MQLFVECLWGVLQHDSSDTSNAPAGNNNNNNSSSSSSSSSCCCSSSRGSELTAEPSSALVMPFANTPAAAAAKLAVGVFQLLPTATKTAVCSEHKGNSRTTTSSSSSAPDSSSSGSGSSSSRLTADTTSPRLGAGCEWVPLLLRLSATLEHGMRFEARHQAAASTAGPWCWGGGCYDDLSQGPSWVIAWQLLSTEGHGSISGLRSPATANAVGPPTAQVWVDEDEPAQQGRSLLRWLLETAAPQQQAAVQQQVLGLLTTAIKHTWAVKGGHCLTPFTADFHSSTVELVWSVLEVLHAPQSPNTPCGGSSGSRSSVGAQNPGTAASMSEELRGSSSSTASGVMPSYAAMVPWLGLLGRSFLQVSAFMSGFLKNNYSEAAAQRHQQLGAANKNKGLEDTMLDTDTCVQSLFLVVWA